MTRFTTLTALVAGLTFSTFAATADAGTHRHLQQIQQNHARVQSTTYALTGQSDAAVERGSYREVHNAVQGGRRG